MKLVLPNITRKKKVKTAHVSHLSWERIKLKIIVFLRIRIYDFFWQLFWARFKLEPHYFLRLRLKFCICLKRKENSRPLIFLALGLELGLIFLPLSWVGFKLKNIDFLRVKIYNFFSIILGGK